MHWTERRRARVSLALGLQARGWKLYGFKEDRSDAMTDYYDPASWDGIAEKNGADGPYVVVVDVKPGNRTILKRSGGYEATRRVPGDDCPHCDGTGQEPEGWTHERAKATPREFNQDRASRQTPGAVPLMAHVVSPLCFDEQGREKCVKCNGLGHTWKLDKVTVEWPEFQALPPHKLWHIERDGRILDSGIGLGPCADWDREKAQAAVERIVERIEAAVRGRSSGTTTAALTEATIRRNPARNGIEVVFPAKPPAEVRAGLKRLGFRWSRRQGLWYARYNDSLWSRVHEFLDVTDDETPIPELAEPDLESDESFTTPAPQVETLNVGGVVFDVDTVGDGPLYSYQDARGWLWVVARRIGAGDLTGKRWWTVDLWVGDQPHPLNSVEVGKPGHKGPLFDLTDDEEEPPPLRLLGHVARLIQLDYSPAAEGRPESLTIEGLTWVKHHYDECRDTAWKTEEEGCYACTIRGDYSGFRQGNDPFWHVLYIDTSNGNAPQPRTLNGQGSSLAAIDDEGHDPPLDLMIEVTGLICAGFTIDAPLFTEPHPAFTEAPPVFTTSGQAAQPAQLTFL